MLHVFGHTNPDTDSITAALVYANLLGRQGIQAQAFRLGELNFETRYVLKELGLEGFGQAIKIACDNHGGRGMARMQQWDAAAKTWNNISDFIEPDQDVLNPLIAADSEAYAKQNNITPRTCG